MIYQKYDAMNEETNSKDQKSGNEFSDKADELFDKSKDLADKADDFFEDQFKRAKGSDAFGKLTNFFGKVEDFMEEKSDEFHRGEVGAKFDDLKEKAESHADELIRRAKEAGQKMGDRIDESIDSIKGKKGKGNNQDGAGI